MDFRFPFMSPSRHQHATNDCPSALLELLVLRESWRIDTLPAVPRLSSDALMQSIDLASVTTGPCPVGVERFTELWDAIVQSRVGRADGSIAFDVPYPTWREEIGLTGLVWDAFRDSVNAIRFWVNHELMAAGPSLVEWGLWDDQSHVPDSWTNVLPFSSRWEFRIGDNYRLTDLTRWITR